MFRRATPVAAAPCCWLDGEGAHSARHPSKKERKERCPIRSLTGLWPPTRPTRPQRLQALLRVALYLDRNRDGGMCAARRHLRRRSGDTRRLRPHPDGEEVRRLPAAWATRSRPRLPGRNSATRSSATRRRTGDRLHRDGVRLRLRVQYPHRARLLAGVRHRPRVHLRGYARSHDRQRRQGHEGHEPGRRHLPLQPLLLPALMLAFASRAIVMRYFPTACPLSAGGFAYAVHTSVARKHPAFHMTGAALC